MFNGAISFDKPLNFSDTSKVVYMQNMFFRANKFNQELNWDISRVRNMSYMFYGATSFDKKLNWDTKNVTHILHMFN
jgi:hypothetical protein